MALAQHLDVRSRTLARLWRIVGESREGDSEGVTDAVASRADTLLKRIWKSPVTEDEAFLDSTFVTITGDGAVQFEWESEAVAIEALVEPAGDFTVYIYRANDETEERRLAQAVDVLEVIERGWSGARRAASGV